MKFVKLAKKLGTTFLTLATLAAISGAQEHSTPERQYGGEVQAQGPFYIKDYKDIYPDVPRFLVPENPEDDEEMSDELYEQGYQKPPMNAIGNMDIDLNHPGEASPITTAASTQAIVDTGWTPPDPVMTAGPSHALVCTNDNFEIFDRFGVSLGQFDVNSFTGDNRKIFDPRAMYDRYSGRYIMLWDVTDDANPSDSVIKIMMSQTSDPTGGWWVYNFSVRHIDAANNYDHWMDYPHVGVNRDAVYFSGRYFRNTTAFSSDTFDKVYFVEKADMLVGGGVSFWWFINFNSGGTPDINMTCANMKSQPVNGNGQDEAYVLGSKYFASNVIDLWRFTTQDTGAPTYINFGQTTVSSYDSPPGLDQSGTVQDLENVGPRLMNAEYYSGNIYTCQSTNFTSGAAVNVSGIKLYKLTNANPPAVVWDSVFFNGAANTDYGYPSICVSTLNATAFVTFFRGASTEFASCRYVAREAADAVWNGSILNRAGTAEYQQLFSGRNRWGDYSGVAVDEWDDKSFWTFGMYPTSISVWDTWLRRASYKPFATVVAGAVSGQLRTSVNLTATVTNSSTAAAISGKSVTFQISGTTVGSATTNASGVATLAYSIPFQLPTTRTITVITSEDTTYLGDTDTDVLTIQKHDPFLFAYARTGQYSETMDMWSYLDEQDGTDIAGRTITYTVGGLGIGSAITGVDGDAHLSWVNTRVPGTYVIGVTFAGDSWYNAASHNANNLTSEFCDTTTTVDNVSGTIGATINLTGFLKRNTDNVGLSGYTVQVLVAGVNVGSDVTSSGDVSLSWLVPAGVLGANTLRMEFNGPSGLYNNSFGTATFNRVANTTLTVPNKSSQRLTNVALEATLTRSHDGALIVGRTVNFGIDGVGVGSGVTNAAGTASFNYFVSGALTVGVHVINASFAGEATLNPSTNTGSLGVLKYTTAFTANPNQNGTAGQTVGLTSTLVRSIDGAGLNGQSVSYAINGVNVGAAVTNISGVSTLNWVVTVGPLGAVTKRVDYAGNADNLSATNAAATFTRNGKSLSGVVLLENWTAPVTGLIAHVEVRAAIGGALIEQFNLPLNSSGRWSTTNSIASTGNHQVHVKVWHWLNKRVLVNFSTSGNTSISHVLPNGDIDDDNEVGPGDFAQLSAAFGSTPGDSNWNINADLDGDGEVGPSDFSILSGNFGDSGD